MVFDNIFDFAKNSAGLFSVDAQKVKAQPSADLDEFEDSQDGAYDDTSTSLLPKGIHGASSWAKVVQEESPEARVVLGFLGSFIQSTQASAATQKEHPHAGSVADAASTGMNQASTTVTEHDDLQKDAGLQDRPEKSDFTKLPKAPPEPRAEAPTAPKATAEKPPKSE